MSMLLLEVGFQEELLDFNKNLIQFNNRKSCQNHDLEYENYAVNRN